MRRPGLIAALAALLLLLAVPAPMQAVRHSFQAPQVVSVSITAAGGTWPYCRQTATVEFATGHIPGYLWVTPYLDGGLTASYYARIRGTARSTSRWLGSTTRRRARRSPRAGRGSWGPPAAGRPAGVRR